MLPNTKGIILYGYKKFEMNIKKNTALRKSKKRLKNKSKTLFKVLFKIFPPTINSVQKINSKGVV